MQSPQLSLPPFSLSHPSCRAPNPPPVRIPMRPARLGRNRRPTWVSEPSKPSTRCWESTLDGHYLSGMPSYCLSFFRTRSKPSYSLGLAAYIYSLDGTTTYTYLQIAASYMDHHSLIGTISVAQAIIGELKFVLAFGIFN